MIQCEVLMKYIVLSASILSALTAAAQLRQDFSLGPVSAHSNVRASGMHCDIWKVADAERPRIVWMPCCDCVVEGSPDVVGRAFGVTTSMTLFSFERAADLSATRCGIRVYSDLLCNDGVTTNSEREAWSVTQSIARRAWTCGVSTDNIDAGPGGMPGFIEACEAIAQTNGQCNVMCASGADSVLTPELRRKQTKYALYADEQGLFRFFYAGEDDQKPGMVCFACKDGTLCSADGRPFGEVDRSGGVQRRIADEPRVLVDSGARRAEITVPSNGEPVTFLVSLDNVSGFSDCMKAARGGESGKMSWRASDVSSCHASSRFVF